MDLPDDIDEFAKTVVLDHLQIRDAETGVVLWSEHGHMVPLPIAETVENDRQSKSKD